VLRWEQSPAAAAEALRRAGVSHRLDERRGYFASPAGVAHTSQPEIVLELAGGWRGDVVFSESGRLESISLFGPVAPRREAIDAWRAGLVRRHGEPRRLPALDARHDAPLRWESATTVLTASVEQVAGGWQAAESYAPRR
jgi:hypothetical protein